MCTVTHIPFGDDILFTTSRDVHISRSAALPPILSDLNGGRIMYPVDPEGGGTWCAVHESGCAVILLNGAFRPHLPNPPYRMSRGRIPLILAPAPCPTTAFLALDLAGVEPFTCIIREKSALSEVRWDGYEKHVHRLEPDKPYIWSSCTLYDQAVSALRQCWFEDWIHGGEPADPFAIRAFHLNAGAGDPATSIRMSRPDGNATVSITALCLGRHGCGMSYLDLQDPNAGWTDHRIDISFSIHV
jgi:hypothetical protein